MGGLRFFSIDSDITDGDSSRNWSLSDFAVLCRISRQMPVIEKALKDHGAVRVAAYCTHAVLSGDAIQNISNSELDELVVTDSIPLRPDAQACPRIRQLSIAEMLAEAIRRISAEESVSSMFMD
jgi:phosphoribosylpyrophosphate synthetase